MDLYSANDIGKSRMTVGHSRLVGIVRRLFDIRTQAHHSKCLLSRGMRLDTTNEAVCDVELGSKAMKQNAET